MERRQLRLTWLEALKWLSGRRQRFNVGGSSMLPLLAEDDDVLLRPYGLQDKINIGDIVVARHPERENLLVVKQIFQANYPDDCYYLLGINAALSTDSRSFGCLRANQIVGKVTTILG